MRQPVILFQSDRREKIAEIQQTLDKNASVDYKELIAECTVAIVSVILLDIKQPPPSLFLQNPKAYSHAVQNASGKVLLKILKYSGFPSEGHRCCDIHHGKLIESCCICPASRPHLRFDPQVLRSCP